jgi:hypothetical protein
MKRWQIVVYWFTSFGESESVYSEFRWHWLASAIAFVMNAGPYRRSARCAYVRRKPPLLEVVK